ncbi:hypothetical protein BT69DRAFT_1288444 [Atractiella rhizophila]|nr:hypothetical protein BT69DRAFT_1288444 [Atractiella rhizophila]
MKPNGGTEPWTRLQFVSFLHRCRTSLNLRRKFHGMSMMSPYTLHLLLPDAPSLRVIPKFLLGYVDPEFYSPQIQSTMRKHNVFTSTNILLVTLVRAVNWKLCCMEPHSNIHCSCYLSSSTTTLTLLL